MSSSEGSDFEGDLGGPSSSKASMNVAPEFVRKLYMILDDKNYSSVVQWSPAGNSFIIIEPNEFAKLVLSQHFKHSNVSSFVRQLNKYDFHKVKNVDEQGKQGWEFQHKKFQKGKKDLLCDIKRKSSSGRSSMKEENSLLKQQVAALQEQLDSMSVVQCDMAQYLQQLSRNYRNIVQEMLNFRNVITVQDQLMHNIIQYTVKGNQDNNGIQRTFNPLNHVAIPSPSYSAANISPMARDSVYFPETKPSQEKKIVDSIESTKSSLNEMEEISRIYRPLSSKTEKQKSIASNSMETDEASSSTLAADSSKPENEGYPMGASKKSSSRSESKSKQRNWIIPPKVLLVEDDAVCRNIGMKLLQVFGCSFDVASDGMDAIKKMNLQRYDIVLMDIVMPNLDGVSATCQIRQFDQQTPIISMTSNVQRDDCMTYLANGMNDILPKPFSRDSLLAMLDRYCFRK